MSLVADRYATTFFQLAQEQKILEAMEETFTSIRKIIADSNDFRLFLTNPLLTYDERCRVLKALFEGKVPELSMKFILFITYKGRLNLLKQIIESFDNMYLASTHQMRAYIKTALEITDADKNFISQKLEDKFKQKMLVRWTIDPKLIGGFRIFAHGDIYDYSFQNQLDRFYQQSTQPI